MKKIFLFLIAILVSSVAFNQSTFSWNFGTTVANPDPSSGTPVSGLTISSISQGNNNGTTTLLTTTSASIGYTGASGQFNAGSAARIGALNIGASGSAYFEFTLTPAAGSTVSVSNINFGSRSTGTGPQAYTIRTSLDAFASDAATGTLPNNSTWALYNNSTSITSAAGVAVTIRIYGYNGTGSPVAGTANWRIDDLAVTVTVSGGGGGQTVSVAAGIDMTEPATNGTFSLSLSTPAPAGGVTVNYTLTGTATQNSDYTDPQNGSITIAQGNNSGTITLNVTDDAFVEGTETIIITLNSASNGYTIGNSTATIDLLDNDVAPSAPVVINEVYGGGGNTGAIYTNDFVELYNNSSSPVIMNSWSIQYTSAAGTSWGSNKTVFSGTIPAHGYFLIQMAGGSTGLPLPTPDATGSTNMSATAGKLVLCNNSTSVSSVANPTDPNIIDKVGYGSTATGFETAPAPAPSNSTSIQRLFNNATLIAQDTDNNSVDFATGIPSPKNSITDVTPPSIFSLQPANGAINAATNQTATITFNENIQKGVGNIVIKKTADNSIVQTINVTAPNVIVSGASASFSLTGLIPGTGYYIEINSGAFKDLADNIFAGFSGNSTWSFTTSNVFYLANFNGCSSSLTEGFIQFSAVGPQVWACTTFGRDANNPPLGNAPNGVQINGFNVTNIPNEDWLISPAFDLTSTTFPLLSFWSRTKFNGEPLQLKVSTDYPGTGDPRSFTWVDLNGKFPGETSDVWTQSSNINLSAFKSSNVHIAFVYFSSDDDGARWTLDDISLTNSPTPPPPSLTVSTTDIQFNYVPAGSTADKTFTFTGNDITSNVMLNATGNFALSKDGISFNSSLMYTIAEANNIQKTVFVRFAPNVNDQDFTGMITISTSSLSATVNLKGSSIDPATTLEVVNWNLEWFGSPVQNPANDNLQEQNVGTIMQNIGADVFGLVEVVDTARLGNIVRSMPGYTYVVGNFGSHVNPPDPGGGPIGEAQKLAFVYKTSLFSNVSVRPMINNQNIASTSYNNWSSGRYPLLMKADITLRCVTKTVYFILIHAKANTSPTLTSYQRRQAAANELHDSLVTYFPEANVIVLGDFNDDLDQTITDGINPPNSSYNLFTDDNTNFFPPTLALSLAGKKSTVSHNEMIDHVMLTNDIQPYYMTSSANVLTDVSSLVSNYGSTTTDHYPIFTRYRFEAPAPPFITSCPTVSPFCKTANNTYTIPLFTATSPCGEINDYSFSISGATTRTGNTNNASGIFNVGTSTILWTAADALGVTNTCQTTVVVNANPTVTIPDAFVMNQGVLANTVYIGYAPASSITLISNVSGGLPSYSYSWSSGSTSSSTTVSPTVNTTYTLTVTDANGCQGTANKNITVIDIRGGNKLDKVVICHKGGTITIDGSSVQAHLNHGDMLASCSIIPSITNKKPVETENTLNKLAISALPNPSNNYFNVFVKGNNTTEKISMIVTDVLGRIIEQKDGLLNNQYYRIGNNYLPGLYFIEIRQGKEKVAAKLLKF